MVDHYNIKLPLPNYKKFDSIFTNKQEKSMWGRDKNIEKDLGIGKQVILQANNVILQIIMLNEVSCPEKDKYHIISLICGK